MRHLKPVSRLPIYALLGALLMTLLLILACGGDDATTRGPTAAPTPAPAPATAPPAPAPTAMASTPTAMPATPAMTVTARATPRATPRPTPTAAPTPAPTPAVMAKVPVSPRLEVSIVPPGHQVSMVHQTFHSSSGPIKTMYEEMVYIDPFTGDYTNDHVVEEWEMSDDATSWKFTLRQGITFHSTDSWTGTELTVEDVIFSIRTSAGESSYNPGRWNIYGVDDANFDIHGDYSFTYNMNQAEPLLLGHISEGGLAAMISKDYWDSVGGEDGYADHPVGTGPFKYIDLKIGVGLLVERVEDHWRKTPEFHELQIYYTPEDATRLAMLLAEEVHLSDIPRTLLGQAEERGFQTVVATLPGIFMFAYFGGLYYDQEKEILAGSRKGDMEPIAEGYIADNPLRNATVRKAMNLAIDRELIIETFWGAAAVPASTYGIPPYRYDFKDEWTPYPYDPEEAKRLLAEAGYPNGFEFDVTTAKMGGVPEAPDVAEVLANMWTEVGLTSRIEPVEFGEILQRARERTWGQQVYTIRYGAGNPFPSDPCYPMSSVAGGCGNPTWEYDELDQLYLNFKASVNPDDILKWEQAMADYLYDNYLLIPLAFLFPVSSYDPGVIEKYTANWQHWGPVRHHEYTIPVYQQ